MNGFWGNTLWRSATYQVNPQQSLLNLKIPWVKQSITYFFASPNPTGRKSIETLPRK